MKKCLYCGKSLDDGMVVDICDECGRKIWGEKMFKLIKESSEKAELFEN